MLVTNDRATHLAVACVDRPSVSKQDACIQGLLVFPIRVALVDRIECSIILVDGNLNVSSEASG